MKHEFVTQSGSERLILVFAGWAMDASPFVSLHRPGYDIAVVWDYASMSIDWTFCRPYREICIVAWSLGVYASAVSTYPIERKVTRRIAVAGTLYPVDRFRGIPEATFAGTLDGLDERSLHKFYRRVAGSRERFERFAASMPRRDIEGLKEELLSFYPFPLLPCEPVRRWDLAIIGREDAIFPAVNQWRAWQGTPVELVDEPHLIDLQKVIDRYIVDKMRVGERFAKGRATYGSSATVQATIVERLWDTACRLGADAVCRQAGARLLELGCGSGMLSRLLASAIGSTGRLELWDIAGETPVSASGVSFRRIDAELGMMELPTSSLSLIASASTIQWFNSPSRFLAECSRVLQTGGYAVLSTFVRGNLEEVAQATGRSLALPDARQWLALVPDDMEVLYSSSDALSLDFASAIEVFRHLKATGVNSLDRGGEENSLKKAIDRYPQDLDGRYRATYRPLIMILQKK